MLCLSVFIILRGHPSSGGYLSLTGPGQTTTPGDLTQAGGFTVNSTDVTGISLSSASVNPGSGGIYISDTDDGGIYIINNPTPPITNPGIVLLDSVGGIGLYSSAAAHGIELQSLNNHLRLYGYTQVDIQNQGGANGINVTNTGSGTITILNGNSGSGIIIQDTGTSGISIFSSGPVVMSANTPSPLTIEADLVRVGRSGTKLQFFNNIGAGAVQQGVTGSLSLVTDANAKFVLTSIIAALANYNLILNSTT